MQTSLVSVRLELGLQFLTKNGRCAKLRKTASFEMDIDTCLSIQNTVPSNSCFDRFWTEQFSPPNSADWCHEYSEREGLSCLPYFPRPGNRLQNALTRAGPEARREFHPLPTSTTTPNKLLLLLSTRSHSCRTPSAMPCLCESPNHACGLLAQASLYRPPSYVQVARPTSKLHAPKTAKRMLLPW
jgi:hypothetical protein